MAQTYRPLNDRLVVVNYAKKLFKDSRQAPFVGQFIGNTPNSIIQMTEDTNVKTGNEVRVGLRKLLRGRPTTGDATLEGNEERLKLTDFSVRVNQTRHAVRTEGRMQEGLVHMKYREEAREGLTDWWADLYDVATLAQWTGSDGQIRLHNTGEIVSAGDQSMTGNNAVTPPSPKRWLRANGAADEPALGAMVAIEARMSLDLIDKALNGIALAGRFRPMRTRNGGARYAVILHPNQVSDLEQDPRWQRIREANIAGGDKNDPIFTGEIVGRYKGADFFSSVHVPHGHDDNGDIIENTRRAVILGAQSGVLSYGENDGVDNLTKMSFTEETFDYKNQFGVEAGCIWGFKKAAFEGEDYGSYVISTVADPVEV